VIIPAEFKERLRVSRDYRSGKVRVESMRQSQPNRVTPRYWQGEMSWQSSRKTSTTKTLHISAQFAFVIERHKRHARHARHVRDDRQLRNFPQSSQPRGTMVVLVHYPLVQRSAIAVHSA
jgi:hypothetical protein